MGGAFVIVLDGTLDFGLLSWHIQFASGLHIILEVFQTLMAIIGREDGYLDRQKFAVGAGGQLTEGVGACRVYL